MGKFSIESTVLTVCFQRPFKELLHEVQLEYAMKRSIPRQSQHSNSKNKGTSILDTEELIHSIVFKNGGVFIHGILLHASARIVHSPRSEIEEVLVFHEFHRIGLDSLIKCTAGYPIDSELIAIKGD